MARVVWKYVLHKPTQNVGVPTGARILTVANQANEITFWAEVDDAPVGLEKRVFVVLGTGHPFPDTPSGKMLHYLGTAHGISGGLVFHVYELVSESAVKPT
jgi:hypothetical protein